MTRQCTALSIAVTFGELWRLLEPSELNSGHNQVGAWGLVDIVAIDMDKFIIEVAVEWAWPPL